MKTLLREHININALTKKYILVYCICMLIVCSEYTPLFLGETDDYSLPAISIINEGDFSISSADEELYYIFFPEWKETIQHLKDEDDQGGLPGLPIKNQSAISNSSQGLFSFSP